MTAGETWLDQVDWNSDGLVPVVAREHGTGAVLSLAWMNREALRLTVEEGRAVYWSRSRGKLWRKGEESGHVQHIHDIRLDCDNDAILLIVEQEGGIACHTGRQSCFFQQLDERAGQWRAADPLLKDPVRIYRNREK